MLQVWKTSPLQRGKKREMIGGKKEKKEWDLNKIFNLLTISTVNYCQSGLICKITFVELKSLFKYVLLFLTSKGN